MHYVAFVALGVLLAECMCLYVSVCVGYVLCLYVCVNIEKNLEKMK